MKHLAFLSGLMTLAMTGAAVAQEEDLTSVPQLGGAPSDVPNPDAVTTKQLNRAMADAVNAGRVQQLDLGESGVVVFQAEGGIDRCDPARRDLSDFCQNLLETRAAVKATAKPASAPEADFATAAPGNVDAFSVDPAATADQIGRGRPETLAAQAIGANIFDRGEEERAPPAEEALPPGLSPELIYGVNGLPPVVIQGD